MTFKELYKLYLEELQQFGSEILPTEKTLEFFDNLSRRHGVMILEEYGFALAVHVSTPYDTSLGKIAQGLGVYVHPDHRGQGLAMKLKERLKNQLRKKGYDNLIMAVHVLNKPGFENLKEEPGVFSHQMQFVVEL